MTKMILMIREDEWGLIVLSRVMMVEDGGSSRGWRDAFFYFRDEIEVSFPSVSFLETRTRIFSLNLMVRDEIENSCHLISKFETRSRSFNSLLSNLSQGIVLGWEQSLQKMKVVWWCGKLCCWICEWTTFMPCGGGRNNIDRCSKKYEQQDQVLKLWESSLGKISYQKNIHPKKYST